MTVFDAVRRSQKDVSEPKSMCPRTRVKDNDSYSLTYFPNKSSAQRVITRDGRKWATLGPDIFVASGVFK